MPAHTLGGSKRPERALSKGALEREAKEHMRFARINTLLNSNRPTEQKIAAAIQQNRGGILNFWHPHRLCSSDASHGLSKGIACNKPAVQ